MLTFAEAGAAAVLWNRGFNTNEIAEMMELKEGDVYNSMNEIREIARGMIYD